MTKAAPAGVDNFETRIISSFRGYYSSIDPSLAPPNSMIRGSQNMYKTSNATIANRNGRKQYDALDTTLAKVDSTFVFDTSHGKHWPIRISNAKLQVLSDIVTSGTFVWYDLMTSLATSRLVADVWWDNTNKKNKMIFVIGDSNLYDWSGGITIVASGTNGTITKTGSTFWNADGFAPTGTVTINGVDYAYTGGYGTTILTGVTPDASALTSGLVGVQKVVTNSNTPAAGFTNDFLKVIDNHAYIGSYTSQLIYMSKDTDYTSFTFSTPRVPGEGDQIVLDNLAKGIGVREGKAHIFAGAGDLYVISFAQITVGTTLSETVKVDKTELGANASAYAHEFIDQLHGNIVYLSQDQQLREYGTFRNLNQPVPPIMSEEISTDLANEDFTLGQLKVIAGGDKGDLIYITAPNNGVSYIHQTKTQVDPTGNVIAERLWYSPFIWGLSRIEVVNGVTIGFSNSNPQCYTLWDTLQWHDDSPSGEFLSYTSALLMAYQAHGRRQGKITFDKIFWEGYMTSGTRLYGGVYYDYQGSTQITSGIIHSIIDGSPAPDQSFFTGVIPPSLGGASLGDNPLGGVTEIIGLGTQILRERELLPRFKIITDISITHCFEYALLAYSLAADDRWEILALGANVSEAPFNSVEIQKQF